MLPIWLRPNIAYTTRLKPTAALGANGISPGFTDGYFDWTGLGLGATGHIGSDIRVTFEGLLRRPVA